MKKAVFYLLLAVIPTPVIIWFFLWVAGVSDAILYMVFWAPYLTFFGTTVLGALALWQNMRVMELSKRQQELQMRKDQPKLLFRVYDSYCDESGQHYSIDYWNAGGIAFNICMEVQLFIISRQNSIAKLFDSITILEPIRSCDKGENEHWPFEIKTMNQFSLCIRNRTLDEDDYVRVDAGVTYEDQFGVRHEKEALFSIHSDFHYGDLALFKDRRDYVQ